MGLINETNAQYYTGEQRFDYSNGSITDITSLDVTLDTKLISEGQLPNYDIYVNQTQSSIGNGGSFVLYTGGSSVNDFNQITLDTPITTGVSVTLDSGGGGYTDGVYTDVTVTGGSGSGMKVSCKVTGGVVVTTPVITDYGNGEYLTGEQLQITGLPNTTPAVFTLTQFYPFVTIKVALKTLSLWDNYGSYAYMKLNDIVNNFMVAYVGQGKLIQNISRSDVIFHAKRGLQEFSYDILRSVKSVELTIPPSLSLIIPQDYVNYIQLSWIDSSGIKHPIYENHLTSNPHDPLLQDNAGQPMQDTYGDNIETDSITDERWRTANVDKIYGPLTNQEFDANVYNLTWWETAYGQRYGQKNQYAQFNGWFTINEREGKFSFSSDLRDSLVIIDYISDGLAYDLDTKIPKMAEQALYMHILHAVLSTRANVPEYVVRRYKIDRRAAVRNAKIRLQNIKLKTFIQQMRGKSKWIKH